MKPKGYLHVIIAGVFTLYMFTEINGFYQSRPHNYRDRQYLLETEFPRLMNQIIYDLPKPDRQNQINRQGGSVSLTYYYQNPDENTIQQIQQNMENNQWVFVRQSVNETLYCQGDISLILGVNTTPKNNPYVYLKLSWRSRYLECL